MAEMTATQLRKDLFRAMDRVLETGEPVQVRRGGRTLLLQEAPPHDLEAAGTLSRAERIRRYFALGPRPGEPDDDAEDIDKALKEYWVWTEPDKLVDDESA